jgi:glycosyltransferase involved in cell wall biosynthesis
MTGPGDAAPDEPHPPVEALHLVVVLPSIEPYSPAGGAIATVVRNVARSWSAAGHHVTVVGPASSTGPYPEGRSLVIDVGSDPARRFARRLAGRLSSRPADWPDHRPYLRGVARALNGLERPPDVLVTHNDPLAGVELGGAAPGARTLLWLHNTVETAAPDPARLLRRHDAVVAVSRYVATWTEQRYELPEGAVATVHNGVDLERFHPAPARPPHGGRAGGDPAPLRIVCHGRVDPNKGFHLVADAATDLVSRGVGVELTVAGPVQAFGASPADTERYRRRLIGAVGAAGGRYLGRVSPDDVPELLRGADVACAPSVAPDPFPLAALEALASGCALLSSGRGGLAELVGDAGVPVDPDQPSSFVDALERLATDRRHLAERRRAARRRAGQFPWEATATAALAALGIEGEPIGQDGRGTL